MYCLPTESVRDVDSLTKAIKLIKEQNQKLEPKDVLVPLSKFSVVCDNALGQLSIRLTPISVEEGSVLQNQSYQLIPTVRNQLLNRLGIHARFFQLAKEYSPLALAEALTSFTTNGLVRLAKGVNDEYYIRALLTNRYGIADNVDIVPYLEEFDELYGSDWEVDGLWIMDEYFKLRIVSKIKKQFPSDGLTYRDALDISNSETGAASLAVSYLHVLSNKAALVGPSSARASIRHTGGSAKTRFKEVMERVYDSAEKNGWSALAQLHEKNSKIVVTNLNYTMEEATKLFNLSEAANTQIKSLYYQRVQTGKGSILDLSVAFASAAQALEGNAQDDLESKAHRLLNTKLQYQLLDSYRKEAALAL